MAQFLIEVMLTLVMLALATAVIWVFLYLVVGRLYFLVPAHPPDKTMRSLFFRVLVTVLFGAGLYFGWKTAFDMWVDPEMTKAGALFTAAATTAWAVVGIWKWRGWPLTPGVPSSERDANH